MRKVYCLGLFIIVLLAGCLGGGPVVQERGSLLITAVIPQELRPLDVAPESILERVTLKEMVFTATKGATTRTVKIPVASTDEDVDGTFEGLEVGQWDVRVAAVDEDDYEVALGAKAVTISAGAITEENVTLDVLPGQLTLQINVPDIDSIVAGKVTLFGLVGGIANIEETFAAEASETVTLPMGEVMARIWPIKVELFDADEELVTSGQSQIPVLPGRSTTGEVDFFSQVPDGLKITVHWNLPPAKPGNVTALYDNDVVTVAWNEVSDAEGYMVFRGLTETGHGQMVQYTLITETTVDDTGPFESGTIYYYRVVAYDAEGLSSNFSETVSVTIDGESDESGEQTSHTADGVEFFMRLAPAATFPTGTDDNGEATVDADFWIAETQVTYELWWTVRQWATDADRLPNIYTFANAGREGSHANEGSPTERKHEPVTRVNWRDSIVWLNALSEMLGYDPVYTYQGHVIRDSTNITACDNAMKENTNGFRLPTSNEWELAARYKGDDDSLLGAIYLGGLYWTPGNYASGAAASVSNSVATQAVAWYSANSGNRTMDVATLAANALGVYDMSGNVLEWCFDISGSRRVNRGGSYINSVDFLRVGYANSDEPRISVTNIGLRLVRTHVVEPMEHTLTIEQIGLGSVTPAEGDHSYVVGTIVNIIADAASDWMFSHWEGDVADTDAASTTVTMDDDKTVTAVFVEITDEAGAQDTHTVNGVDFHMRLAPAATFPTGTDDDGEATVDTPFWMAETQVTYELWWTVRQWALDNGYTFANEGGEGSHGDIGEAPTTKLNEPVTMVNWRDSIVWSNALSEILGFTPVYTYQGNVIKDSTNATACDNAVQENTNGFRLPSSNEWELAARYKGDDSSHGAISRGGLYWTPGNYASGATANTSNATATQEVAWYNANSGGSTKDVGLLLVNGLGVYDMSGNVWEWCFTQSGSYRVRRGGSWYSFAFYLRVGSVISSYPDHVFNYSGLRLARTHF